MINNLDRRRYSAVRSLLRCTANPLRFAARLILSDPIRFQQRAGMSAPDPSIEISTPRLLQQKPKPPTFFERSTEAVASVTAKSWASVKANKLSLSLNRTDADTDGDGLLTREEYVAKRQHHQLLLRLVNSSSTRARVRRFAAMLAKEGIVGQQAANLYAKLDKDNDGQLTEEEVKQAR